MVDWGVRDSLRGLQGWLLPPLLSLLLIPGHNSSLRQVLCFSVCSLQYQYFTQVNTKYGPVQGILSQVGRKLSKQKYSIQNQNKTEVPYLIQKSQQEYPIQKNRGTHSKQNANCNTFFAVSIAMILWHQTITNT